MNLEGPGSALMGLQPVWVWSCARPPCPLRSLDRSTGASGEGVAGGVGMMGMVFSASTTVLADSTVPPIVPTFVRTTAPSKGPSPAVPLLVPVSNLCAVREKSFC